LLFTIKILKAVLFSPCPHLFFSQTFLRLNNFIYINSMLMNILRLLKLTKKLNKIKGNIMKIIEPFYKILFIQNNDRLLSHIEKAGRTCYKSEDKITANSAESFVKRILQSGHHSVIEHANISVRFICDRGVTHELVRHRLAAYSQESTRYANYSKDKFGNEITVIRPYFWKEDSEKFAVWKRAMEQAEQAYMRLLSSGARPEEARSVLPNSLKTEIVMTCNLREWRHVIKLRCSKAAHPQIQQIMLPLLSDFYKALPAVFEDLYKIYNSPQKPLAQKLLEKMK
jgi:thymidylate synthase (FAD)